MGGRILVASTKLGAVHHSGGWTATSVAVNPRSAWILSTVEGPSAPGRLAAVPQAAAQRYL